MSRTANYPKVIDHLTDVIKELNVPCAEAAPAAPSAETRRVDAVDFLKALLSELEQESAAGAAAEHSANADTTRVFASAGRAGGSVGGTSSLGASASSAMAKPQPQPQIARQERALPPGTTTVLCTTCWRYTAFRLTRPGFAEVTQAAPNGFCGSCGAAHK
jgi:hypothetical protein